MQRRTLSLALLGAAGSRAASAQPAGWAPLFNGRDLDGWDRLGDANWRVEAGALSADSGNGFLVSRQSFGDFQLRAEVWIDPSTNSGIFVRCTDPARVAAATSYEVNLWDERPEQRYGTGAIVDVAAVDPMPRAGGRWNEMEITARGDSFSVVLNGQRTVDNARDAKFRAGPIALQRGAGVRPDNAVVRFRKVELRAL